MRDTWWDDPTQSSPPPGTLSVEPRGDDSWEFIYPRLTLTIYDFFEGAIGSWRVGDVEYAEHRYRRLLLLDGGDQGIRIESMSFGRSMV